jgi:hypothetical protein
MAGHPAAGRNPSRDFRGERRSNLTHGSTTEPDALLYRRGPGMEARLCFVGHVLMENRSGLLVDAELTRASGHAERLAALAMLDRLPTTGPATLGADRGFDARDFVLELRARRVTPHGAQNTSGRRSDRRPDDAPSGRRPKPARAPADRGGVRLDQDHRRAGAHPPAQSRTGALVVHPRGRGLPPDPPAPLHRAHSPFFNVLLARSENAHALWAGARWHGPRALRRRARR